MPEQLQELSGGRLSPDGGGCRAHSKAERRQVQAVGLQWCVPSITYRVLASLWWLPTMAGRGASCLLPGLLCPELPLSAQETWGGRLC